MGTPAPLTPSLIGWGDRAWHARRELLLGTSPRPSTPGGDRALSPVRKSVHIFATPEIRPRKNCSPASIPRRTVCKPQPHRPIANWLGLEYKQRHPGTIGSHPRIGNPSITLQIQQPGDKKRVPPGRHRSARCGNPNHTDSTTLSGWGSFEVPPHAGTKIFHPKTKSFQKCITPTNRRRLGSPGSTTSRTMWKPQTHGLHHSLTGVLLWFRRTRGGLRSHPRIIH